MTRQAITEAGTTPAAATPVAGQPGRFLIQLITPGWGSSGYYSPAVLEAAAKARVFPAGLQMFLDHEHLDGSGLDLHGNRSVKDLAAVLEADAEWNGEALVGTASVFGPYREALSHMAESIGVSIRASADVQPGEAEGRQGMVIAELVEGYSADFVTRAGRGGKILQVIESARRAQVDEGTANDTRDALQTALTDAYGGEKRWVGVRDFDEATVWYWQSSPDSEALYQLAYSTSDSGAVTLSDQPVEVRAKTVYVPVQQTATEAHRNVPATRPGSSTTTTEESEEDTMPEIAESELRTLREAAGRVQALESERDAAVQRAETAESERDTAVAERDQLREADVTRQRETVIDRVLGEAVEAASVTLNEFERAGIRGRAVVTDGQVDESATRTAFDNAVASIAESRGAGRPRNLGGRVRASESGVDFEAELDQIAEAAFGGPIDTIKEA